MQKTTNYKLPKWEKADRILMDDFNGLTETLDTALHGVAVSAEAAQTAADSEATARANAVTAEATARENADAALRTAVDGKQATLTGAATTIAASNLTASRALVSNASGKVAVSAVTAAELGCLDGVTSAIQTQLDGKQATLTGAATSIAANNLTASRALVSNASGKVAVSAVTAAELGYLDGVTSAVQTQLNGKAASSHTHAQIDVAGLTAALAAVPKIAAGTYTGTGTYGIDNKTTLTFAFPPKIVFIVKNCLNGTTVGATFLRDMTEYADNSSNTNSTSAKIILSWSSNSVTWYTTENNISRQLNDLNAAYHYFAIG